MPTNQMGSCSVCLRWKFITKRDMCFKCNGDFDEAESLKQLKMVEEEYCKGKLVANLQALSPEKLERTINQEYIRVVK